MPVKDDDGVRSEKSAGSGRSHKSNAGSVQPVGVRRVLGQRGVVVGEVNEDAYADDQRLYPPHIPRRTVVEFNRIAAKEHMEATHQAQIAAGQSNQPIEHAGHSTRGVQLLNMLLSRRFDRRYLHLFLAWLVCYGAVIDGYVLQFLEWRGFDSSTNKELLLIVSILPVLMLLMAGIPITTTIVSFIVSRDLLHYVSLTSMREWALGAIFTSQFLVYCSCQHFPPTPLKPTTLLDLPLQKQPSIDKSLVKLLPSIDEESPADGVTGKENQPDIGEVIAPSVEPSKRVSLLEGVVARFASVDLRSSAQKSGGMSASTSVIGEAGAPLSLQNTACENTGENLGDGDRGASGRETSQSRRTSSSALVSSSFPLTVQIVPPNSSANTNDVTLPIPTSGQSLGRKNSRIHPIGMFTDDDDFVGQLRKKLDDTKHFEQQQRQLVRQGRRSQAMLKSGGTMVQWSCVTCGRMNEEPTVGFDDDVFRYTGDEFNPRAVMRDASTLAQPSCGVCLTPKTYAPPQSSAHLFEYFGGKTHAFSDYPVTHTHGKHMTTVQSTAPLYGGVRNSSPYTTITKRLPLDWRLPLYISSQLPMPLRYTTSASNGTLQIGDSIECTTQKLEWTRGKIQTIHGNGMYDIIYDSGEEVQFVKEKDMRLRTLKLDYAYHVELTMGFCILFFPISLFLAATTSGLAIYSMPFLASVYLLAYRALDLVHHIRHYKSAGLSLILKIHGIIAAPYILMLLSALIAFIHFSFHYTIAVCCFSLACICIRAQLNLMQADFSHMWSIVAFQAIISAFLLAIKSDDAFPSEFPWLICLAPAFTASLSLLYFLKYVSLAIHPSLVIRRIDSPVPKVPM